MRSQRNGGLSAITKVKVLSPEMHLNALGQGLCLPEASIAACVYGECAVDVPGSKAMAGNLTVHTGTWESRAVPNGSFRQAEEARRKYGGMAVGLTHSRGVVGVMLGESLCSLEGVSAKTQGMRRRQAVHGDG